MKGWRNQQPRMLLVMFNEVLNKVFVEEIVEQIVEQICSYKIFDVSPGMVC